VALACAFKHKCRSRNHRTAVSSEESFKKIAESIDGSTKAVYLAAAFSDYHWVVLLTSISFVR
jgi:hypothetical protein